MATIPQLSIVVASAGSSKQRDKFLQALVIPDAFLSGVEVLVIEPNTGIVPQDRGPVRFIPSAQFTLPHLWADGIAIARGEWIAVMETSCPPAPGWLAAARAGTSGVSKIFGGCVEMAEGHGVVDWSAYFCEYAQFMEPLPLPSGVFELPGNNLCFHRDLLDIGRHRMVPEFWKTYWCRELVQKGVILHADSAMVVQFDKRYRLMPFLRRRYDHGRCFAGMRIHGMNRVKQGLFAVGSIVLPALMLARILRKIWPRQRARRRFVFALPFTILAVFAWAFGEAIGYCRGPGNACGKIL